MGIKFLAIVLCVCSLSARAAPTCVELKGLWYDHYLSDFKIAWNTSSFSCDGKKSKRVDDGRVALAIYDLESARFKKHGKFPTPNFYALVKKSITKLDYDPKCEEGTLASASGSEVTLCPEYFDEPREDRAATLVHEARHTQEDDPEHKVCIGGKHKGEDQGCDQKFFAGAWKGSGYNADVVFYDWNLKRAARNELSKSVMKAMIRSLVPERFNEISPKAARQWRK